LIVPVASSQRLWSVRSDHLLTVLGLIVLSACSKSEKPAVPAEPRAASSAADAGVVGSALSRAVDAVGPHGADAGAPLQFVGVVRGVVKLAKGAKLPLAPVPLSHGVKPPSVAPCPPVDLADQRTMTLAKQTGGLSPVHTAITGMSAAPAREPVVQELFIDACRLRPTLLGAMRGDTLRITNRSESAMIPSLPGDKFMQGMLRGESREATLGGTQTKISCAFGSYCGESLVVATSHPLFAVTSSEGFFTIEKVPLDQDLTIHAWAPLFDVASQTFRLSEDKREVMIELSLTPLPPKPTPAAAPDKPGVQPQPAKKGAKPAPSEEPAESRGPAFQ
jgi:hypothetical protein